MSAAPKKPIGSAGRPRSIKAKPGSAKGVARLHAIQGVQPGDGRDVEALPSPPTGLAESGLRLWTAVVTEYALEVHEILLLVQACRMADHLDRLAAEASDGDVTVENMRGDRIASPAIVEFRQQAAKLATLLASLRLPSGEDGSRPQRRGAARRPYGARSTAGA